MRHLFRVDQKLVETVGQGNGSSYVLPGKTKTYLLSNDVSGCKAVDVNDSFDWLLVLKSLGSSMFFCLQRL